MKNLPRLRSKPDAQAALRVLHLANTAALVSYTFKKRMSHYEIQGQTHVCFNDTRACESMPRHAIQIQLALACQGVYLVSNTFSFLLTGVSVIRTTELGGLTGGLVL